MCLPFFGAVAENTVVALELFESVPLALLRKSDGLLFAMVDPHVVQLEFLSPIHLRTVVAGLDHDPAMHPVAVLLVFHERGELGPRGAHGARVGDLRVPLPLPLVVKLLDDLLGEASAATDTLATQDFAPGVVVKGGLLFQPNYRLAPITITSLVRVVNHPVVNQVVHCLEVQALFLNSNGVLSCTCVATLAWMATLIV